VVETAWSLNLCELPAAEGFQGFFEPANGDALLAELKSGLPTDVNFHDFEWGNGGARVIVDGRRSADAVRDMFNKNPRLKRLDVAIFPGGLLD
jgi:hypothetical protein